MQKREKMTSSTFHKSASDQMDVQPLLSSAESISLAQLPRGPSPFSSLSQLEVPTSTASQSLGKVEWHGFSQALLSRGSSPCDCSVLRLCISSGGGVASKAGFFFFFKLLLFQCPVGFLSYRIQSLRTDRHTVIQ